MPLSRASTRTSRANCSTSTASTTRSSCQRQLLQRPLDAPFTNCRSSTASTTTPPTRHARHPAPTEPSSNPAARHLLSTSPLFNPQMYAIRRLVNNRIDTLDTIEVLQEGHPAALADQARLPGQGAHRRLDDARPVGVVLPATRPRQLRQRRSRFSSTTGSGTSATARPWSATAGTTRSTTGPGCSRSGHLSEPARPDQLLPRLPADRPDRQPGGDTAATYIFSPKYAITASTAYDFGINQASPTRWCSRRMGTDVT